MKNLIKLAGEVLMVLRSGRGGAVALEGGALMVLRGGRIVPVALEDGVSIVPGCRRGGDA